MAQDRSRLDRLSVFISADLDELGEERAAAADAVARMRFNPVLSGHGLTPMDECHVFLGIYGSGARQSSLEELEAEYEQASDLPKLIYVKQAQERDESLRALLKRIQGEDEVSYKPFGSVAELATMVQDDLALALTERYGGGLDTSDRGEPNVPRPLTQLVGREQEIDDLADLLRSPARLITVIGAGGIGKTRVALDVAALMEPYFGDGVYVIPLAPVKDPENVCPTIARALGIREGEISALEGASRWLGARKVLLVLDNFEHLLDASGSVGKLLAATTEVKTLITSRILLNVRGEVSYEIPPLELPTSDWRLDARQAPSVQLFLQRAQEVRPDLPFSDQELKWVAEICRRLDGLPLAIELAAARCRVLGPKAILDRLEGSFELLRSTARDMPERQKTLIDTIDWSYQLLDAQERDMFARLSVFPSYFALDAAQVVASEGIDVPTVVSSLLDKSLLRRIERGTPEPWFGMLETIRQFALEKLSAAGLLDETFQRHASWLAGVIERAAREVRGPKQVLWLERGEFGHDNVRAALRWTRTKDPSIFITLVRGLAFFWEVRGYIHEGRKWTEMALDMIPKRDLAARAGLHRNAGRFARAQDDLDAATAHHLEAIYLSRSAHNKAIEALALKDLGVVALEHRDLPQARELSEQALSLGREYHHQVAIAESLNNLGVVARFEEDWVASRSAIEQSLQVFEQMGDLQGIARALMNLATAHRGLVLFDEAIDLYKQSLGRWREVGGRWMIAECMENIAMILAYRKDTDRAARLMGAAERLREQVGAPWSGSEKELIQEYVEKVRAELEKSERMSVWDEGRAMGLDEAVDYALAV